PPGRVISGAYPRALRRSAASGSRCASDASEVYALPRHERALRLHEEVDDVRDVFQLAVTLDRLALDQRIDLLFGYARDQVRANRNGSDGVDRDTEGTELSREHPRQTLDAGVRRDVRRLALERQRHGDGREIHDAPVALALHQLRRRA